MAKKQIVPKKKPSSIFEEDNEPKGFLIEHPLEEKAEKYIPTKRYNDGGEIEVDEYLEQMD